MRVAGNLAFPLLLVGGLFLLSRRSQGGPGGPGGNNPLAFGKSKAKFQMEPNTGITFDDVAGVDEAKQDFMEVSHLSLAQLDCFYSTSILQWGHPCFSLLPNYSRSGEIALP